MVPYLRAAGRDPVRRLAGCLVGPCRLVAEAGVRGLGNLPSAFRGATCRDRPSGQRFPVPAWWPVLHRPLAPRSASPLREHSLWPPPAGPPCSRRGRAGRSDVSIWHPRRPGSVRPPRRIPGGLRPSIGLLGLVRPADPHPLRPGAKFVPRARPCPVRTRESPCTAWTPSEGGRDGRGGRLEECAGSSAAWARPILFFLA